MTATQRTLHGLSFGCLHHHASISRSKILHLFSECRSMFHKSLSSQLTTKQVYASTRPNSTKCLQSVNNQDASNHQASENDPLQGHANMTSVGEQSDENQLFTLLTSVCRHCYERNALDADDIRTRSGVLKDVSRAFRNCRSPPMKLYLFGSSSNGFGFKNSDLDICLLFRSDAYPSAKHFKRMFPMIMKLKSCLANNPTFTQVWCLPHARVPIITFRHAESGLGGDIALSNEVALYNTVMLQHYSRIDERAKFIVCALKHLTKRCKVADAKHQFLSSYAFTLMAIYYLQQLEVPVLPVLQELHQGSIRPQKIVDHHNVWFFRGTKSQLEEKWPGMERNQQTIGELWLGFLRFYSGEFDFARHYIYIAQHKRCVRRQAPGMNMIQIRDPFEIERNLCNVLTSSTSDVIQGVIERAYSHFRTLPPAHLRDDLDGLEKYYFDPEVLWPEMEEYYKNLAVRFD